MSDHIELKRQLDQIQWVEKFIKYEFEVFFLLISIGSVTKWLSIIMGPSYDNT